MKIIIMVQTTKDPDNKQIKKLEEQVSLLEELIKQSHMRDIAYHFTNKREVIKVNLLAGLARGVGLTIGTALFIAVLFYVLRSFVSFPILGEYIAKLLDIIDSYRQF